jgi:hypothetical protein
MSGGGLFAPILGGRSRTPTRNQNAAVPLTLYQLDLNAAMWAFPQSNSTIYQQMIADANIAFRNLTASKVTAGSKFEIDV